MLTLIKYLIMEVVRKQQIKYVLLSFHVLIKLVKVLFSIFSLIEVIVFDQLI